MNLILENSAYLAKIFEVTIKMKTTLFISVCFITILILKVVPYHTTIGTVTYYYNDGLLPDILIFAIICLLLFFAATIFSVSYLRRKMPGELIISRVNIDLTKALLGFTYWSVFVFLSQFLSRDYLYYFKNTSSYFFVILGIILAYELLYKSYVQKVKPGVIALEKDTLYVRSFFRINKRSLKNLKLVSYNLEQKTITLQFYEGLENIHLVITEYEPADLQKLIEKIKTVAGSTLSFDENFKQYFPLS